MDGIGRDVCVGDKDGKLNKEDCESGEGVLGIAEGLEVDGAAETSAAAFVVRETLLHETDGEAAHDEAYETDDASGPGEANLRGEVEDDKGEHDAAEAAGDTSDSSGEGTSFVKVVTDDGNSWIEEEGG